MSDMLDFSFNAPKGGKVTPSLLQSEAGGLMRESSELAKRADAGTEKLATERTAELERRKQERQSDLDLTTKSIGDLQKATLEVPQTKMPSAELGPPLDPKATQDLAWGLIAMSLVAVAGSKSHYQEATAALDGMLHGFRDGAEQNIAQNKAKFDREMKLAKEEENKALRQYEAILKSKEYSMNQIAALVKTHAAANQDWEMEQAAREKNFDRMYARVDRMRTAADRLLAQAGTLQNSMDARAERAAAREAAAGQGGLSEQAIDMLAHEALKDKSVLANLGRGVQGAKDLRAITNRMADISPEGGPGMAQRRAEFRADSNSLNKLTSSYDAITSFEANAVRNGQRLITLADKADTTGVPVIERWIRAGRKDVAGDVDVNNFNAQMQLYRAEMARILTNPNLSGQLTDSARHEVEGFLSGSSSAKQIKALVPMLERDFDNRKKTLEEQMDAIRDRMTKGYGAGDKPGAKSTGGAVPNTNAKGWTLHTDKNGNKAYVSPDGKQYEEVQ